MRGWSAKHVYEMIKFYLTRASLFILFVIPQLLNKDADELANEAVHLPGRGSILFLRLSSDILGMI